MSVPAKLQELDEVVALRVARELAMNLHELDDILANNGVTTAQWAGIKDTPFFMSVLKEQLAGWASALNTQERVKLKSAALIEEWLPEANRLAHDSSQPLSQRVELMKLLKALSGMGITAAEGGGGERFTVTINLGNYEQIKIAKEVTPQVIDGEVMSKSEC